MRNLLARVLCVGLAAGMLLASAGCGDTSSSGSPASGDASKAENTSMNLGGKTMKVAVWYEPEKPSLGNSDSEDAWYYSLKNAEESYNCKVEWVIDTQDAHFSKFVQSSLSGEVYADILMCHSWNYVSLIKQNLLVPTTELIKSASDAERWNQTSYVLNGENWGIMPKSQNYTPINTFLINTKLLNALKLENPQGLARSGQWTWDKFREYCRAATDPAKEQYGVGCFMLASTLKVTNNFSIATQDSASGKYYNGFTYGDNKDRGMELLEFLRVMSLEDKSVLGAWDAGQEALAETLNAFKDGKLLFAYIPSPSSLKKSGFEDYSVVTPPLGPSNNGLADIIDAFAFWSLPSNSDFTAEQRAAFWMEAKRTWDPADTQGYYEESEDSVKEEMLDKSYMTMEDVEFLLAMGKNMSLLPGVSLNTGSLIADNIFGAVMRGDSTPAAVVSSTDGELQAIIDATYNN